MRSFRGWSLTLVGWMGLCWLAGCGEGPTGTSGKSSSGASQNGAAQTGDATADGDQEDLSQLSGLVKIDGSSSLFPVSAAAAEEFQIATKNKVQVTVNEAGTGGGFKKFLREEIDICDASRPMTKDEIAEAAKIGLEFIELPVCFDALTIAVHPSNPLKSITIAELKAMWEPEAQGKITRWNQVNPAWPDAELVLFGAGTSSGTFEYFTGAVTGKAKNSRGDYTASEEDNMLVTGIKGNKNALGYIPFAYYEPNKESLKALAVDSGQPGSEPVLPSQETVEQGKYTPFARPLFLYVSVKAAERPEVQAFVRFYLRNGARLAQEESYVPLPSAAYAMARERFKNGEAGTGFNGVPEFGLRVEEILSRPPKKVLE